MKKPILGIGETILGQCEMNKHDRVESIHLGPYCVVQDLVTGAELAYVPGFDNPLASRIAILLNQHGLEGGPS